MTQSLARQIALDELRRQEWIADIVWLGEVDSTNLEAKRQLRDAAATDTLSRGPILIVADSQTRGRGRGNHDWWSPDGCLMLTLVISSGPPTPSAWPQLGMACGVAVAEAVASVLADSTATGQNPAVHLKWPNDVYVQSPGGGARKVAGILIETQTNISGQMCWLIGIGLNVSIDWSMAPLELRQRATCVASACQSAPAREAVLVVLTQQLRHWIEDWQQESNTWVPHWLDRCLLSGKVVHARSGQLEITGRCEGIDADGRLLVRNDGGVESLNSGEILSWQG